ncbi:MAG TPA: hypothetical protein VJR94_00900 [Candidatus Nitrosocosmicus sp.]|nr:hypothetical protein [Candidatus Nitrosocosmicus sp.]
MSYQIALVFCLAVIALFLSFSLISIVVAQNIPLENTYFNEICGLSIDYPFGWIVREFNQKYQSGPSSLFVMAEMKPDVPDGFKTVVELEAEDITAYHDMSVKGIGEFMEFYLSETNVNIKESLRKDINNSSAHQIIYERLTPDGNVLKTKEIYIPAKNNLYVIRYDTSSSNYYDKYISYFDSMIQTIKVDGRKC